MTWNEFIENQKKLPYFKELIAFVNSEYSSHTCYPPYENIFEAFKHTEPSKIKAVILGQDPYHEPNQAHGLCFSVLPAQKTLPRSLNNIYKELANEYGSLSRQSGCLSDWAQQGVLMLNTVLSVREHEANSHKGKGWEIFTDSVIAYINTLNQPIVFMLWGKDAQKKQELLTKENHLVLCAAHPSPLSARRGFFGCNHFKLCNKFLTENGIEPINWIG